MRTFVLMTFLMGLLVLAGPSTARADSCDAEGADWSDGFRTRLPWTKLTAAPGFDAYYCVGVSGPEQGNKEIALVRLFNRSGKDKWINFKSYVEWSNGDRVTETQSNVWIKHCPGRCAKKFSYATFKVDAAYAPEGGTVSKAAVVFVEVKKKAD